MSIWLAMNDEIAAFQALSPKAKRVQLEQMSKDSNAEIRNRSLIIAKRTGFVVADICLILSYDQDDGVRFMSMDCARTLKLISLAPRVMEMLMRDSDECVRSHAALAVRSVCSKSDIPYLEYLIEIVHGVDHEDVPVRSTLIESIKILAESMSI